MPLRLSVSSPLGAASFPSESFGFTNAAGDVHGSQASPRPSASVSSCAGSATVGQLSSGSSTPSPSPSPAGRHRARVGRVGAGVELVAIVVAVVVAIDADAGRGAGRDDRERDLAARARALAERGRAHDLGSCGRTGSCRAADVGVAARDARRRCPWRRSPTSPRVGERGHVAEQGDRRLRCSCWRRRR